MRNSQAAKRSGIVQLLQVLISFQKHVLAQVERIFAIPHQPQQVIVDTLLPARHQDVIGVHVARAALWRSGRGPQPPEISNFGSVNQDAGL